MKAVLLYLSSYHLVFGRRNDPRKIDGGDWVADLQGSASVKTFFSRQGTLPPLETSATHSSFLGVRGINCRAEVQRIISSRAKSSVNLVDLDG